MVKYVVKPGRRHTHFIEDEDGRRVRNVSGPGSVVELSPSQVLKFGDALIPYNEAFPESVEPVEPDPVKSESEDGDNGNEPKTVDDMTKGELLDYCKENDVEVSNNWNKPRILEAIEDANVASTDTTDDGDEDNSTGESGDSNGDGDSDSDDDSSNGSDEDEGDNGDGNGEAKDSETGAEENTE